MSKKSLLTFDDFEEALPPINPTNASTSNPPNVANITSTTTVMYLGNDEELRVNCRKLLKKDPITRQKALKQILARLQQQSPSTSSRLEDDVSEKKNHNHKNDKQNNSNSNSNSLLTDFIPFFGSFFTKIHLDPSHHCREEFSNILFFLLQQEKKLFRGIIDQIISSWWQLIHDPNNEIAKKYLQAFNFFLEGTVISKRFTNFLPKILGNCQLFFMNLRTKEELFKYFASTSSTEGWEENYLRIMISNMNGFTKLIEKVFSFPKNEGEEENINGLIATIQQFLQTNFSEEKYLQLFYHPLILIASAGNNTTSSTINPSTTITGNSPANGNIPNKAWRKSTWECLLTIWQYYPIEKWDLLSGVESSVLSSFLVLILDQFEVNDVGFNNIIMKVLIQFITFYHSRFTFNDAVQVFQQLEKLTNNNPNVVSLLLLPVVAAFPVELYGIYKPKEEIGGGKAAKKNQTSPFSLILQIIENVGGKTKSAEDLIAILQIITYLTNKIRSQSSSLLDSEQDKVASPNIVSGPLELLLGQFLSIFKHLFDLRFNKATSRAFGRGETGTSEDALTLDLQKCLKVMNKTTNEYFPEQWTELLWKPLAEQIRLFLVVPTTKYQQRIEITKFIAQIVGEGEVIDEVRLSEFHIGIDQLYLVFTAFIEHIFTQNELIAEEAFLSFQILGNLSKVTRWRGEHLHYIKQTFQPRYLKLIYELPSISYSHLLQLWSFLEALYLLPITDLATIIFPYQLDCALTTRNVKAINVLLRFYEGKLISQNLQCINSAQLAMLEKIGTEIISAKAGISSISLVDEVSYLLILVSISKHHRKFEKLGFEIIQQNTKGSTTTTTTHVDKSEHTFERIFQLSLLATNYQRRKGSELEMADSELLFQEEIAKISWHSFCVQLFIESLDPLTSSPLSMKDKEELRYIRKLLKIVLIYDWESVRQSFFPLLISEERQQCVREINIILQDETKGLNRSNGIYSKAILTYLATLQTVVDLKHDLYGLSVDSTLVPVAFTQRFWQQQILRLVDLVNVPKEVMKSSVVPSLSASSSTSSSPELFFWEVLTQSFLPLLFQAEGYHPARDFLQKMVFQSSLFIYWLLFISLMEQRLPSNKLGFVSQKFFTAVVDYYQQSPSSPFASNLLRLTVTWLKEIDEGLQLEQLPQLTDLLLKLFEKMIIAVDPSSANPLSVSSIPLINAELVKDRAVWYLSKAPSSNEEDATIRLKWTPAKVVAIHNIEDPEDKFFLTVSYSDDLGDYREVQTHSIRLRLSMNPQLDESENYYSEQDGMVTLEPPLSPHQEDPTVQLFSQLVKEIEQKLQQNTTHPHEIKLRANVIRWILQYYSSDIITSSRSYVSSSQQNSSFARLTGLLIQISKNLVRNSSTGHIVLLSTLLPSLLTITALHPIGVLVAENLFFHPDERLSTTILFDNTLVPNSSKVATAEVNATSSSYYHELYYLLVSNVTWKYSAKLLRKIFAFDVRFLHYTAKNTVADASALSDSVLQLLSVLWYSAAKTTTTPFGKEIKTEIVASWEIILATECIQVYYQLQQRPQLTYQQQIRKELLATLIHHFLDYYYHHTDEENNSSLEKRAGLPLFETIISEDLFYSVLLQRFPSYQQPIGQLLRHSTNRFLSLKLFTSIDFSTSFFTSLVNAEDVPEEERFLAYLPAILREEMLYQFSIIASASSVHSVIHSSSNTRTNGGNDSQKDAMTVIATIVELEIKENFVSMWLVFLTYLDNVPHQLNHEIKASFTSFCDRQQQQQQQGSWFLLLISSLLKWTNTASIQQNVNHQQRGGKQRNQWSRQDLFSIFSLNFEELFGTLSSSSSSSSSFPNNPTSSSSSSSFGSSLTSNVSWFAKEKLEKAMEQSKLELISMDALVVYVLYKTILTFPSMFRNYWTHYSPRAEKDLLLKFIQDYVRNAMITQEVKKIQAGSFSPTTTGNDSTKPAETKEGKGVAGGGGDDAETALATGTEEQPKFEVIGNIGKSEIAATIIHDESKIELVIEIPNDYPLKNVDISCKKLIGIPESKWLKWRLTMISLINSQDQSILDAILWWKSNLEKELEGIDPCIICYSVIHSKNSSLPSIACPTCKNKFHSSCLYTWFKTSGKNKCVLCQQQMI